MTQVVNEGSDKFAPVNPLAVGIGGHSLQLTSNDTWITTLAARFGWAYDRVLFYSA